MRNHLTIVALAFLVLLTSAFTYDGGNHFTSTGTDTDLQLAINAASNTPPVSTIALQPGVVIYTTGVSVNKPVKIVGPGASRFKAWSETSRAIGTGSATFTVGNRANWFNPITFTNGEVIKVYWTPGASTNWMVGSVTAWSSPSVTINITNVSGTGTYNLWTLGTIDDATCLVITNNTPANSFRITQQDAGYIELSGIHEIEGTNSNNNDGRIFVTAQSSNSYPILIHDCRFSSGVNRSRSLYIKGYNQHVIFRNSFDSGFNFGDGNAQHLIDAQALGIQNEAPSAAYVWARDDTMGVKDVGGTNNCYIEDNYFAGVIFQAMDLSLNTRGVVRHNVLDCSGITSHGNESGPYGLRTFEIYNNDFHFLNIGTFSPPLDYQVFIRGGTGVMFSNVIDNPSSGQFGQKAVIKLTDEGVDIPVNNAVPAPISCAQPYPYPHGVGQDFNGTILYTNPICFWTNSGSGGNNAVTVYDGAGTYPVNCSSPPAMSTFIANGRDYTNGVARVGYAPYAPYPHQLVVTLDPSITASPQNLTVFNGANATFTVTASGTPTLHYQWKFNGSNVGTDSSSYTRTGCTLADSGGSVTCVVTGPGANSPQTSSAATLTVNTDPFITVQPSNQTVTAPATATFSVTATGTAPLTYQWYKNGVSIGGATLASYTTPPTVIGDSGSLFHCVVSGPGPNSPQTSSDATLGVNGGFVSPTTITKTYGRGTHGKGTH